jgi:hypothetical protein
MGTTIRRALPVIAVTGAVMSTGATAQAINCNSFGCFNRALNRMQTKLNRDDRALKIDTRVLGALVSCLQEYPVAIFGNRDGSFGYTYNDGTTTFNTTALDASLSGDPVNAWLFGDKCNTHQTAARNVSARVFGSFGPVAPQALWPAPELRP